MGANDIRLNYIAEVDKALAAMGSIEKATKAQIAEVQRVTRALTVYDKAQAATATVATGKVVPGLNATKAAAGNLQAQLFDIGTGLQGGMNPLTILAQQGPQVLQAMSGAGGGVAALKTALISTAATIGPIVLVLGAAYAGWQAYTEAERDAAVMTENAAEVQRAIQPVLDDTRRKIIDLAEATGELTAAEAAHNRAALAGLSSWQAAMKESTDKAAKLRVESESLTTQVVDFALAVSSAVPTGYMMNRAIDGLFTSSKEYTGQADALNDSIRASIPAMAENVDVTEKLAASRVKAAKATTDLNSEERTLAAQAARRAKSTQKLIDESNADRDAMAGALRKEAEQRAEYAAQDRQDAKEAIRLAEQVSAAKIGFAMDTASAAASIASSLAEMDGKYAREAAATAKGLAMVSVVVNTAVAVMKALAELGPVAGGLATAGIIATGIAQEVAIAAEPISFHTGGVVRAELRPGEGVITAGAVRDAGGEAGVREMNRRTGSSQQAAPVVQMRYKHRIFNTFVADNLDQQGSPLRRAIKGDTRVGHR